MSDSSFSKGIGLAIAASVFWGSMGVCAQYLLQQCSFTPLDLVSMRLVLAGLILLIMERLVFGRIIISPLKDIRTTVGILVAGLLILVSQLTFMLAVAASNAGTAAIVLTLVPLICAFWLSITEKRPLTMREGICFVLAASGVFLIVTKGNFSTLDLSFAGVLWGFVSAIFSAAYSIQPRKLIMKVGVGPVVGFGMLFGGLVASVMNPPWTMNVQWTVLSVSAFTYVVLVGTVAAFWCYLSSLKYVSAVIVGLMVCFEPLSAYLLSVFAFDLRIGMWEGAGISLVLLNVLVLSLPKKSSEAIKP